MFVANNFCIVTGYGVDEHDIASFDKALIMAGAGDYNLVKVSSIVPPNAKQVLDIKYPKGSVLYTAYSTTSTRSSELISSAIAAAIPLNSDQVGVIMEYSCVGDKKHAIDTAKKLASEALLRRNISEYNVIASGIEAQGTEGVATTTFAAIILM